ncbi:hypothetical protein [Burkholderia gladioli]|uniref:hypothetical protein n=1 Tax=Burkholderia gladioli TaxID=28095 RepID=UPI0016407383|nr:hypothetical protein [Burkholderia gladioli]
MISGPFVLRKTKAAQSAPVQVQPAQLVQPTARERVEGNVRTQGAASILKAMLRGGAIGFSIVSWSMSILGMILNSIEANMFGLIFVLVAMLFGSLSMVVD